MIRAQRLKRAALLMLVGTCLMMFAVLMVGMGEHTRFVIAVGGIVIASCIAIIVMAGRSAR